MTLVQMQAADPGETSSGSVPDPRKTDADLAARIAGQDAVALSQVVSAQFRSVFAVARRMVGSDADAEDIAQDVFLTLWRKPPDLSEGRATLSTWLYRVASNRSIDWLRRKRPGPLDDAMDEPEAGAGPEEFAAEGQVARSIDKALSALPERQRLALTLTYYQGLSNIEAAEIMESSVDALESLLARARRRLRSDLEDEWHDLLEAVSFAHGRD